MKFFEQRETSAFRHYSEKPRSITLCIAVVIICSLTSFIAESHARRNFFIERPRLGMKLSFESEKDEREGPVTSSTEYSTTYSEELNIQTKGWVYHPALLEYSLNLSPEWQQVRDTNSETEETRSFLSNYLAELEFLQYKPYSLTLTGSRDTSTIRSNFAERSRFTTDLYSAVFSLKYPILPAAVAYYHQEGSQTGFFDSDSEQDQVGLSLSHGKYLGKSKLELIYRDQADTRNNSLTETNHQSAHFLNTFNFDTDNKLTMRSDATVEETDSTDLLIKRYSIYENLDIEHRDNLHTEYIVSYEKDNRLDKLLLEPNRSEAKTASFSINHRLYNNLDTHFRLRSSESSNRSGRTSFHDAGINWNYSRDIPWGKLKTRIGYDYSIRDSKVSEEGASIQTNDEPLTLTSTIQSDRLGKNIDPDKEGVDTIIASTVLVTSDIVTNNFGTIYTENIDYRIISDGAFIRIVRTAGSSIADPQTVFVHYRYIPNPAFDYELFRQDYAIHLILWSSLSLYYAYNRADQDLLRGETSDELINNASYAAGGEYTWKWSKSSFDWEDHYTINSPTRKWTASETLTFTPGTKNFLYLSGSYGLSKSKDTGDTERSRNVSAKFQRLLTSQSNISLTGRIIDISGQTQDFTNSEIASEYNLYYRIYRLTLRYIFKDEKDRDIDERFRNQYFLLELRRSLF